MKVLSKFLFSFALPFTLSLNSLALANEIPLMEVTEKFYFKTWEIPEQYFQTWRNIVWKLNNTDLPIENICSDQAFSNHKNSYCGTLNIRAFTKTPITQPTLIQYMRDTKKYDKIKTMNDFIGEHGGIAKFENQSELNEFTTWINKKNSGKYRVPTTEELAFLQWSKKNPTEADSTAAYDLIYMGSGMDDRKNFMNINPEIKYLAQQCQIALFGKCISNKNIAFTLKTTYENKHKPQKNRIEEISDDMTSDTHFSKLGIILVKE